MIAIAIAAIAFVGGISWFNTSTLCFRNSIKFFGPMRLRQRVMVLASIGISVWKNSKPQKYCQEGFHPALYHLLVRQVDSRRSQKRADLGAVVCDGFSGFFAGGL